MAKPKEKPPVEKGPETEVPVDQREFTTREKGGHVVYLQKLVKEKDKPPTQRPITVRLIYGQKFDPFVECGPNGRNRTFRDIAPEKAFEALKAKAEERESPVVMWEERPMTDEQAEHAKQLKSANQRGDEQKAENEKLRSFIAAQGLKPPADL